MDKKPYLVGITGGSASGKTLFLQKLREKFNEDELCVISQDDYYKPLEHQLKDENGEINFDIPDSVDLKRFHSHLLDLIGGKSINKHTYTFNNPEAERHLLTFKPAPIIIIEGLFIFHYTEIFNLLDLKLFIDADEEIKFQRRLQRDITERKIPEALVVYQWNHHVRPAFEKYLAPYKEQADVIIINNSHFNNSLTMVENHFKTLLGKQ